MNEKYGIELELITNKFKEKIENIKNAFNGLYDKKVEVDTNTAQLEYLKNQISEISALLDYNQKKPFMDYGEVLKTEAELEKLTNQYNKLSNKQTDVKSKSDSTFSGMESGIKKITSKIKRFGLALLSIRTVYSLISRASQAYLSTDTDLTNKLQAVWTGLGAMLAPIIERIVNTMLKAVKYINIFVKALTGVDLLAKASSKSLNGTNSSAKALSKTLGGFDELTNLDTTSNTDSSGVTLGETLGSVDIDTTWADRIQAFGEWVKSNWHLVVTLIGGTAIAIWAIKNGLTAIQTLGIIMIIQGVVTAVKGLIAYLQEPSWENFGKIIIGIGEAVIGLGLLFGSLPVIIAGVVVVIVGIIASNWDKITSFVENGFNWLEEKINGLPAPIRVVLNIILGVVRGVWDVIWNILNGIFTGFKNILDGIIKIFKGDFKNGIIQVGKGIANIFIGIINGVISGINTILSPIRSLIVEAGKLLGKGWTMSSVQIPKIAYLNTGTNYVPEDQMAYIHKGEAIVPKKFNSQEYFGQGNDETNSLLRDLIEKVGDIEINPYTTIKEVGKTAVNYINNKNRQLGRSVIN